MYYPGVDERISSKFEVKTGSDPFISYLGFLRDSSLKAAQVFKLF